MRKLRVIFASKKEELLVVSYLTTVVVLTSSTTIFFLENSAQPDVFSSIGVCAWWSIETITSLGYGDIVPKTSAGRVFGSILAVWGIILFAIPGAVLSSGFIEVMLEKQRTEEEDEYSKTMQAERRSSTTPSTGKHFFAEPDEDGALRIALPATPPSSSGSKTLQRMSPRVATAIELKQVRERLDAMANTQVSCYFFVFGVVFRALMPVLSLSIALLQHELQEQLRAQQTQLNGIATLLEALVAAPTKRPQAA